MGLWEFLQQWRGGRAAAGVTASVLLHALVIVVVLWGGALPIVERWRPKPGDSLIVELPMPQEGSSPGTPDVPAGQPIPEAPRVAVRTPPAPPARHEAPAPRKVASAPRPAEPAKPAPRPVEASRSTEAPRAAAPRAAEPPADNGVDKPAAAAETPASTPSVERVPPGPRTAPGNPQVAGLPPGAPPASQALPDIRSALRRGGGGRGEGRGGILGDPIPLDTPDPKFSDFMGQVKRQIQAKLTYPCIKHPGTFECEPKDTEVIIHFGILKMGRLQFVDLWVASPWPDYDDASMNAIRLAQPFPAVPAGIMASLPPGSTGIPISGRFRFQVTYSTLVQ